MPMPCSLLHTPYTLRPIAETGSRFRGFGPYVPSLSNEGVVAFQATLADGRTGIYAGDGGPLLEVVGPGSQGVGEICSHPDINPRGDVCFYAKPGRGNGGVFVARDGALTRVAGVPGPLGPTMNEAGDVAFRAPAANGVEGIFVRSSDSLRLVADTADRFGAFHGLPVINSRGSIVFRADLRSGIQGLYGYSVSGIDPIVETGARFASLGSFPTLNDAGCVAFCATCTDGTKGVFAVDDAGIRTLIDSRGAFESFRGVLLNSAGRAVFYATPRGGRLGIWSGPTTRVLSLADPLYNSVVEDFALNPVSINGAGQLGVRVRLADGRQVIVRADPSR
jgi:hypothetical protein